MARRLPKVRIGCRDDNFRPDRFLPGECGRECSEPCLQFRRVAREKQYLLVSVKNKDRVSGREPFSDGR